MDWTHLVQNGDKWWACLEDGKETSATTKGRQFLH